MTNGFKDAVIDGLVVVHIYNASHDADPRKAVKDLIDFHVAVALDPQVSSDAQALIDRGARESVQPARELTDGEIIDIRKQCYGGRFGTPGREPWADSVKFARAVLDANAGLAGA